MKKKAIRICIPMAYLYPLFNKELDVPFGGAEVDMYNVATELSQDERYAVTVWVADFGQPRTEWYGRVRVIKIPHYYVSRPSFIDKIIRYLSLFFMLLFSKQDIYLTKTASEMDGWVAFFARGIARKKHVHRLASDKDTKPESYIPTEGKRHYKLHWYGLCRTDLILAQSQDQQQQLLENTGLSSIVISNGLSLPAVDAGEKKCILWVSRFDYMKRPELFLDLAEQLPQEQFVFIMPVMHLPNEQEQRALNNHVRDILSRAKTISNVRYIPFVPFHEIQEYYNQAKLFVNTSSFEGFPNTFIQACIGKTPILSFVVDPGAFIRKNDLGFVCNESIEAGVSFIESLNEEKVKQLGENAARYLRENHDIRNTIVSYKREFEKLMATD